MVVSLWSTWHYGPKSLVIHCAHRVAALGFSFVCGAIASDFQTRQINQTTYISWHNVAVMLIRLAFIYYSFNYIFISLTTIIRNGWIPPPRPARDWWFGHTTKNTTMSMAASEVSSISRKHETYSQCRFNAGPTSNDGGPTLSRRRINMTCFLGYLSGFPRILHLY